MKKISIIIIFFCTFLLLNVPHVFAQNETDSSGIDRIETIGNTKIIYHTDGIKEISVTEVENVGIGTEGRVSYSVVTPLPPSFPIREILEIVREIVDNILGEVAGCFALAWAIWNRLKRLRGNRPKDYDEIERLT
jgi:hypothetical protein